MLFIKLRQSYKHFWYKINRYIYSGEEEAEYFIYSMYVWVLTCKTRVCAS